MALSKRAEGAKDAPSAHTVDFYFSFRSPYSYLATPQVVALASRYEVEINVRVVRPLALRDPGFFERINPLWPPYLMRDTRRIAERLAIPYAWPNPDPVAAQPGVGFAAEQPHIRRLNRMGVAASEAGRGLEAISTVGQLIWSGATAGWDLDGHLDRALAAAGLDPAAVAQRCERDAIRLDAVVEANEKAQIDAGHWGVPLFVFQGEPFFGQDRMVDLAWRMQRSGVRECGA